MCVECDQAIYVICCIGRWNESCPWLKKKKRPVKSKEPFRRSTVDKIDMELYVLFLQAGSGRNADFHGLCTRGNHSRYTVRKILMGRSENTFTISKLSIHAGTKAIFMMIHDKFWKECPICHQIWRQYSRESVDIWRNQKIEGVFNEIWTIWRLR